MWLALVIVGVFVLVVVALLFGVSLGRQSAKGDDENDRYERERRNGRA